MFCVPGLIFGGTEGVGSLFHVLRARTRFRRYRGRQIPFSCFTLPDSFSAVPRASLTVFKFSAPENVFGGTDCVGSRFHFLRARTSFRRYRGRPVPFSCISRRDSFSYFARPDSYAAVPRASGLVFMFCAPVLLFGGTEGIRSRFHVLRSRTRFRRYRGRRVQFSRFALPDSFLAVPGRRFPFSYFARPDSFSAVPWASGSVFTFCAPRLVFGGTGGVGSHFLILRARRRIPY
jgi:hypothetical protein